MGFDATSYLYSFIGCMGVGHACGNSKIPSLGTATSCELPQALVKAALAAPEGCVWKSGGLALGMLAVS